LSFVLSTNVPVPNAQEREAALRRTEAPTSALIKDLLSSVSDTPPREWTCGTIVGYLRACGYSWSDALTAMDAYLRFSEPPKPGMLVRHSFKLELITCSVGCAPFLKTCLERNMRHFDRTMVVTDPDDKASQDLAEQMDADVVISNRFYAGGRRFDRGSVYNRALQALRHKDQVVFMDVDIVLPDGFRAALELYGLKQDCFYGMSRRDIHNEAQRQAFLKGEPFESVLHGGSDWGFGFFQLFSPQSRFLKGVNPVYPSAEDVNMSDYLFRQQFGAGHHFDQETGEWHWDPVHQHKLPFECFHLGSNGEGTSSLTRHYPNPHGPPSPPS